MINVQHLSKHFGKVKAVDDISFEVKEHENLVLLGTSGCGKTTPLKMINRLIEPSAGSVLIDNQNISEQQPEALRRGIGYVMQDHGLFPHYTVADNIAVVPQLLQWDKKRTEQRISELVEKLHLGKEQLRAYPGELSGGQQQRVGLARALAADPPVLLMDEPFGALDNVTRSKIRAEFKELDELKQKTIIMVTHDVQEAFELGDRICLMDKGKIVQNGPPAELLFEPKNDFVRAFLQEQRLLLEFKSIRLRDVWKWLGPSGNNREPVSITDNTDLWTSLELLKYKTGTITISRDIDDERRNVTFGQLMQAFYKYKKLVADE